MSSQGGPDDPLLLACRALSRQMDLFDESAARHLKLGRNDLRALNLLEHGPLSAATIADRLHLTRAGVTSLLDRLEGDDLVARTSSTRDRRVVLVELRPATWAAFARIYRPLGQRVRATAASWAPAERRAVTDALEALSTAFDEARSHLGE
jgi:DNA-binding MarR family transcriptional regulator